MLPIHERRCIAATHILPWHVQRDPETGDEVLIERKRHSALFKAIATFARCHVGIILHAKESTINEFHSRNCFPIQVDKDVAFGHYEGYCKTQLWPLFHYLTNATVSTSTNYWPFYVIVNQMIADEIARLYREGDYSMYCITQFGSTITICCWFRN